MLIKARYRVVETGPAYELADANMDLTVGAGIAVVSNTDVAIRATNSNHDIRVLGTVWGGGFGGMLVGNDTGSDHDNTVFVGKTGHVQGTQTTANYVGVRVVGTDSSVVNEGWIGGNNAVVLEAFGDGTSSVVNRGTIFGGAVGVRFYGFFGTETFTLNNSGLIAGQQRGINAEMAKGDVLVTNTGTIRGDVYFGSGDDLYNGREGRAFGVIFGGDGDDRFAPGTGAETITAGLGVDRLDFRYGGGVRVALDGDRANTGNAKGDQYVDVDNILGSMLGNDDLLGSVVDNRLVGNGGNDRLHGGLGGEDTLAGGAGRDTLSGGILSDTFILNGPRDGADRITDFLSGSQSQGAFNDTIALNARAFGLREAVTGELNETRFHSGRTNQAQDGNDRFIFRTGDETLWFDRDGKGGAGPVLIADFTDGVRLLADDFILI